MPMKTSPPPPSPTYSIGFLVDLVLHQKLAQEREAVMRKGMLGALDAWDRAAAKARFDVLQEWNQLNELFTRTKDSLLHPDRPRYIVDRLFLRDLVRHLTPTRDEAISYVTGYDLGGCKALTRIWDLRLDHQTPVHALANPTAAADALIDMLEHGAPLLAMAHSHPGAGASATRPSSIDITYFNQVKASGADVLGIIVTRDGTVRFLKVDAAFDVLVQCHGVQEVSEHVYKITP